MSLNDKVSHVTIMGNIKGMILQVKVPLDQRDYLRFLWWNNGDVGNLLVTYRMTVHLFCEVFSPVADC